MVLICLKNTDFDIVTNFTTGQKKWLTIALKPFFFIYKHQSIQLFRIKPNNLYPSEILTFNMN